MRPQPTLLLGLGLWLGQQTLTEDFLSPPPSICTQQGPEGQPVTFMCRGPAGVSTFRLEKRQSRCSDRNPMCMEKGCVNSSCVSCNYMDKTAMSQSGPGETEAQFPLGAVSGDNAWCYRCLYRKGSQWSLQSEPLKLVVTSGTISAGPPGSPCTSVSPTQPQSPGAPTPTSWSPVGNRVCLGLAGAVLLLLAGILAEAWYTRHQGLQQPQGWSAETPPGLGEARAGVKGAGGSQGHPQGLCYPPCRTAT